MTKVFSKTGESKIEIRTYAYSSNVLLLLASGPIVSFGQENSSTYEALGLEGAYSSLTLGLPDNVWFLLHFHEHHCCQYADKLILKASGVND